MVDVKSAITAARIGFRDFLEVEQPLENVRLEEVELSEDEKYWMITLGYDTFYRPYEVQNVMLSSADLQTRKREYKLFRVNAENGNVESMKIRTV
ncbi:MAG: hypothetical protein ACFB0D_22460 [Phormidesmis sp.]